MKDKILASISDARQLEKLYRSNKSSFKRDFMTLYPQLKDQQLADFWNERLNFENEEINWGTSRDLLFVIGAALLAGVIAKLPTLLGIDEEFFYPRNIGFVIFPLLTAFFAWKNRLPYSRIAVVTGATITALVYINTLPDAEKSDTLTLSCIHLLLFLWGILGYAFVGGKDNYAIRSLDFLKYNGDLIVMTALILISGGILTGITIGLFSIIGINIEEFYFRNIVVFGLPAAPIIATYLTQSNPTLVGKVSPVIAKIFSPLVLVMLLIYLVAIFYSAKDPYNDREFLLLFNALLIGVMAIIFFSIAETSGTAGSRASTVILILLSVTTVIVNSIALSAILFRISEWGITPNRAAVLGSNILILINLLLVSAQLFRILLRRTETSTAGKMISSYLPIYFVWAIIVTFFFPLLFNYS